MVQCVFVCTTELLSSVCPYSEEPQVHNSLLVDHLRKSTFNMNM